MKMRVSVLSPVSVIRLSMLFIFTNSALLSPDRAWWAAPGRAAGSNAALADM